jgi:acyl transferase domain-containing protein/NADP-dependent 3-hydroxy acid dehydrogenase YdfG/acyl carrier protein
MTTPGSPPDPPPMPPIAVVGLGSIMPGSRTLRGYWDDIVARRDRLTEVPPRHWSSDDHFHAKPGTADKVYTTKGGFLPQVDFPPLDFGLPPNAVPATDTAQLLALIVAREVLAEATRGRLAEVARDRISVILGVASATELTAHMSRRLAIPTVERALRHDGLDDATVVRVRQTLERTYVPWQESTFPGLLANVVAGRIANRFDLGGSNYVVDAACASSLAAVAAGINELGAGDADLVMTGGVDTLNDILMFMCFAQVGALSESGQCRPFSADADGTMLGEGVCLLALKRLADAERDGDPIYAVLRGLGSSSDGRARSIYAPLPAGQALAMKRAYARAGYGPETVGLVEAHGTATRAGDLAELESMSLVFAGAPRQRCALGSVKSQIGHTKATAGAAGLAKAILALHHKVLPATIGIARPTAGFDFEASPFFVNTETRPWLHDPDAPHPRRASVSAFGFGGTNFHVTVEEHRGEHRPPRLRAAPAEVVVLSAAGADALAARCRALASDLGREADADGRLAHVARASQRAFDAKAPARLAVVARAVEELAASLQAAPARIEAAARGAPSPASGGIFVSLAPVEAPPKVAFLFPGQGSQAVGMGGELAVHVDACRAVFDRLATRAFGGERLQDRIFPPPAFDDEGRARQQARLTATEWAQPAVAVTSLAFLAFARALGLRPAAVCGHSLGELTALCAAGVIDEDALLRLARRRGELMAEATEPGAMLALGCSLDEAAELVRQSSGDVVVANHNGPRQVVISGRAAAVEAAGERARARGVAVARLAVSTAFHSPVVAGAAGPLRAFLDQLDIRAPRIPVVANASARPYPHEPDAIRAALAEQVSAPVRFVEDIERLHADGARVFVEVGPGNTLARLAAGILAERPHVAVSFDHRHDQHEDDDYVSACHAIARLAVAGVPLDFEALWAGDAPAVDPASQPRPKLVLPIDGSNYGKPPVPEPRPARAPVAAPAATPLPVTPPVAAAGTTALAEQLQAAQAPLIAAQMEFHRLMTESHTTFLRAVEASWRGLGAAPDVASLVAPPAMPVLAPAVATAPATMAPPPATTAPPPAAPPPPPAPPPPRPVVELVPLMLAVVAEKTGYPTDMLDLSMDLESDLGIDSIKRVEILSMVHERAPGLPDLDPAELAPLRTLRQIVEFLQARLPTTVSAPAAAPVVELVPLILAIVAEKTGYPTEMLELSMDLESDLGIDSIKRVEILSTVRERASGLPDLDPAAMAPLRTLGQIVHFLEGRLPDATTTPAPAAQGVIRRFVIEERPAPAVGLAMGGLFAGPILVTPPSAMAAALARRLGAAGVAAHTEAAELDAAAGVVFVGGLEEEFTSDAAIALERQAFAVARRLAARFRAGGGLFVTVQDTTGPHAFERAFVAGLSSLAKTAAREWPRAAVKAIALPRAGRSDEELAAVLCEELLEGGPELEVALPPGRPRSVRALREVAAPAPAESGRRDGDGPADVFVVSGGARGVTAAIVAALARRRPAKFVLLGRSTLVDEAPSWRTATDEGALKRLLLDEARAAGESPAPRALGARAGEILAAREIARTLRAVEAAGGEALYVPCDIRDRAEVAAAVERGRARFGRVTGIIHGAGVLADARLDQKTDEHFERVFGTKVEGLRALLAATEHDDLRTIALLSSIAATVGNAGQADYAMANEVLNAVAAALTERRGEGCRVVALGYGPWQGGMVSPALQKHFLDRGVGLISLEAGAEATADVLLARAPVPPALVLAVGASMGPDERVLTADIVVDATRTPQLADHRVQGTPVLPVAMAIEWIARSSLPPSSEERAPWCLRDFHVDRGVTLPRFETATRLHVIGEPRDDGRAFELRDERGGLRFRAHVPATWRPAPPASPAEEAAEPDGKTVPAGALYSPSHLFHGPRFQVVQTTGAFSRRAARATILGTRQKAWPAERWLTDPAALDGALQTAFLWTLELTNRHALPLAIAELVVHRPGSLVEGPLEVQLSGRSLAPDRSVCDLVVRAPADGVLLTLTGVELYAVPSGTGLS